MASLRRLSRAKNTSVRAWWKRAFCRLVRQSPASCVRTNCQSIGIPKTIGTPTSWEMLHHLIRVLEHAESRRQPQLVAKYGARKADVVRELAYRLYTPCERKKRAQEAGSYNALVQSWPEIIRLAQDTSAAGRAAGRALRSGIAWPSATTSASARHSTSSKTVSSPFVEREMKSQHAQLWIEEATAVPSESQTHLFEGGQNRNGTPLRCWP